MAKDKNKKQAPAADVVSAGVDDDAAGAAPQLQVLISDKLTEERQANREGPSHPAHPFHDSWLADRGLDRSYDRNHWTKKAR